MSRENENGVISAQPADSASPSRANSRAGEESRPTARPASSRRGPMGSPASMARGDKPANFKGSVGKLVRFMSRYRAPLVAAVAFAVLSAAFNIAGPKILSSATTELFNGIVAKVGGTGGIDFDAIARILAATLALYLVSAACSFAQGWVMTSVSQKTCYGLRRAIAEKIERMPVGYFERTSKGDVLSRITNDVDTLGQSLNQGVTQLITSTTTIAGVIVMMLTINPLMTLVAVLVVPVSLVLVAVVVRTSQKYFRQQQATLGVINGMVEETFSGHAVVRAFNGERAAKEKFAQANGKLYESAWKSQFLSGLMMPIMNFVGNLGYVAVAVAGSVLAVQRVITVGDIQAFIQYVRNLTQPISQLSQVSNVIQQMAAASERIFAFLEEPEEEPENPRAKVADAEASVEFDHVRFGYRADEPVIKDFSAKVEPGQRVALVGPTGAGKTTMVKLLMRFYDVDAGAIRIGGTDVRDFARADVRSAFGMVLQDTWLFNGTIRENIRYGRLDATDEEVEAAARAAFVHHFVMTMPEGYDTVIDEDASNVSQGQRQLITIARAILADRRMLILDEATSNVDTLTEERIQRAMDALMEGRTAFVIAHRLSTIKNADLILVMDHGDIVEQGTHEELLAKGGAYADLYNSQFSE